MTRGCTICQCSPAKKAVCCGIKLCEEHASSVKAHNCPRAAELDRVASNPRLLREWRAANEPEQALTIQVLVAVRALADIEEAWQGKKRGVRESDLAPGLPDVCAIARGDARFVGVETKRNHKAGCICPSCEAQRDFGMRLVANGGVYVNDVRSVQAAVEGVRMGLARARGRPVDQEALAGSASSGMRGPINTVGSNG